MRLLHKISQEIDNIALKASTQLLSRAKSVSNDITFVSQFANPDWAEKILKDGQPKTSDPNWQQSGATNVEEYEKWVTTTCGMACTVMVLNFFKKSEQQTVKLAKEALEHGVYQQHTNELSSMRYKEYVDWINGYGLSAKLYSRLTTEGIKYVLSKGGLVIASVNPNIRGYDTAPKDQTGGHLVLVTGYDDEIKTITLQNPSGFVSQMTHHNHSLDIVDFKKFFAGRGIALYQK